jgi:hypothetical protein
MLPLSEPRRPSERPLQSPTECLWQPIRTIAARHSYRLSDELRPVILVACSKCDWRAAFSRDELIAFHGATCSMPSLLNELTKPGSVRLGNQWDHCGVYSVEPIGGLQ